MQAKMTFETSRGCWIFIHDIFQVVKVLMPTSKETILLPEEPIDRLYDELTTYFQGKPVKFTVPIAIPKSPNFTHKVLKIVSEIKWGEVKSYGDIAKIAGLP
ncbi:MGMT family protein [Natranaerobius trueperi]|uniref:Uncharacterized protein n=1 Tax=Natranaerobius trueperi TaxID=759412 RepID=A0A226BX59_9FIRM|nr:MGMT family protein [Natranaerobius trueperi]OWZ83603.1 hypothetical protein CDO51_07790 [Natranaerobius trueperi]